jgi:uncharacterized membrane protein HdeD (DUF308 family)
MIHILALNWWALAIRGLLAILFGILTFIRPGVTLTFLALLFGAYVLLDGIFSLVSAFRGGKGRQRWWMLLIEGVLGITAGIVTFLFTPVTVVALVYLIAAWAIVTGVFEVAAAIGVRRHMPGEWLLLLMGFVSILLGVLLIGAPVAGAVIIAYWIGAYAIIFGTLMLAFAFRLKAHPARG